MKTIILAIAFLAVSAFDTNYVHAAPEFEKPPVLKAKDLAPNLTLSGQLFRVEERVPTDGLLAAFTIQSDFGEIKATGPGMLEIRLQEIKALEELEKIKTSDAFVAGVEKTAKDAGKAVSNIAEDPVGTVKGIPSGVGRFFERAARQAKTGWQQLEDLQKKKEEGTSAGSAEVAVQAGKAVGKAAVNVLGYEEQRRNLAKELRVDPYTTNPILKKQLDDIAWASFAGGLGINTLARQIEGGKLVTTTAFASELVWDKSPGDIKVWIDKTLRRIGISQDKVDRFLRHPNYTLSMQAELVMALDQLTGVSNRPDVIELALTAESEEQARFIMSSVSMLSRYHKKYEPISKLKVQGTTMAVDKKGELIVPGPVDYVSWTERVANFANREDLSSKKRSLWLMGIASAKASSNFKKLGWKVHEKSLLP